MESSSVAATLTSPDSAPLMVMILTLHLWKPCVSESCAISVFLLEELYKWLLAQGAARHIKPNKLILSHFGSKYAFVHYSAALSFVQNP